MSPMVYSSPCSKWSARKHSLRGSGAGGPSGGGKFNARIARLSLGNFGDHKPISDGLSELRIDTGPGYRVYYTRRGKTLIMLLIGGAKGTQKRDIKRALGMMEQL